jgi:hypothetical protein
MYLGNSKGSVNSYIHNIDGLHRIGQWHGARLDFRLRFHRRLVLAAGAEAAGLVAITAGRICRDFNGRFVFNSTNLFFPAAIRCGQCSEALPTRVFSVKQRNIPGQ